MLAASLTLICAYVPDETVNVADDRYVVPLSILYSYGVVPPLADMESVVVPPWHGIVPAEALPVND